MIVLSASGGGVFAGSLALFPNLGIVFQGLGGVLFRVWGVVVPGRELFSGSEESFPRVCFLFWVWKIVFRVWAVFSGAEICFSGYEAVFVQVWGMFFRVLGLLFRMRFCYFRV